MHVSFASKKMLKLRIKNKILNLIFYFIEIKKRIMLFKRLRKTRMEINYDDILADLNNNSFEDFEELQITSTEKNIIKKFKYHSK